MLILALLIKRALFLLIIRYFLVKDYIIIRDISREKSISL